MNKPVERVEGFSKLDQIEKRELVASVLENPKDVMDLLQSFAHPDAEIQELLNEFSENTLTNFPLPYCIAPNFKIDGQNYLVPMVIEESSVVAAASNAAKFWFDKGGFKTEIINTEKVGQVHFIWNDDLSKLTNNFGALKQELINGTMDITENMRNRGGGILDIVLKDFSHEEPGLMQLFATFETVDSMGANFINSCLERFAAIFKDWYQNLDGAKENGLEIVMCILSNLTPNCMVKCWVECDISDLDNYVPGTSGEDFARRFRTAIRIAQVDSFRATTHNKGIYNGVDAVVLASGNDFRAVEACGHAFASMSGKYTSLTDVKIDGSRFVFTLHLPLALGVVGGLTNLHPLVKLTNKLLGNPSAKTLMGIAAAAGLANNFGAVKSLVTTGIQRGHMKMHLFNIMKQLGVEKHEQAQIIEYFKENVVSVSEVRKCMEMIRENAKV
jgi:hydroxymethylglutaryl-CoA reductase